MWEAFDSHFDTFHYDWTRFESNKINADILSIYDTFKPDYVFMQIQNSGVIYHETAGYMSERSFVANWTGDVRFPIPQWYIELAPFISVTLFSNMTDVISLKNMGFNSDFWQVGFDEQVFSPFGDKVDSPDIVFMGSNYADATSKFPLSDFRVEVVKRLSSYFKNRFSVYGSNWQGLVNTKYLTPEKEAEIYRSAKIAINLSHFDYSRYSSDRLFRIMGSGCFCLSHYYKDLEHDFTPKEHLDTWDDIDSLIYLCNSYIKNERDLREIAQNGCRKVREEYNWNERVLELKKMIHG
jgi:spore maturation protein CgeB